MSPLWPSARVFGRDGVPAGVQVIVSRRQRESRPGSTSPQLGPWSGALSHTVDGVGLDRTSSVKLGGESGDSDLQSALIFGPSDADIHEGDRITFPDGVIVEVVGIPDRSANMFTGWRPPMSAAVEVTHG